MEREQVMNVLNHIDPALIEAADLPVKARKPRWTRIALTAACLCLALLGVVYAVESAGVRITFFEEEQLADRSLPGYQIEIAPDYIPLEQLSEEVQDYVAAYPAIDIPDKYFSSLPDAVEFLGVGLPDNSVLEQCYKSYGHHITVNGKERTEHCIAQFFSSSEGEVDSIWLNAGYLWSGPDDSGVIRGVSLRLSGKVYLKETDIEDDVMLKGGFYNLADIGIEEVYTTPSGLEATIVRTLQTFNSRSRQRDTEENLYSYTAYFVLNGVTYQLCAMSGGAVQPEHGLPPAPELALTALKETLDAFS
ncbi:MAG: hypothetical protein HFF18_11870 [Oscillospiraceae bacterium]|nr:hypothetical protein [Oscillospiraceae bacterium]